MRILVIGGGAREHAIAWRLAGERGVSQVLCAPGNAGIAAVARCLPADLGDPAALLGLAQREDVDLTVVGPELPLSAGVADVFRAHGAPIIGPAREAAALEWSKAFAKAFMRRHQIPTAQFEVCESAESANAALANGRLGYPLVIKADGLAAGKGVVIAEDRRAAERAVREAMVDRRFGAAGERLVFEEFLVGEEASYFVLASGTSFVSLSSAQDYKRIYDNDRGPNTGGMGAFAPSTLMTPAVERVVIDRIVRPVLDGMHREGRPYHGFLYVGLMLTPGGPEVVEFNVRLGDPEAQVVLPRLAAPLSTVLTAAAAGTLPPEGVGVHPDPHVAVVLAARGYPDAPETGGEISGIEEAAAVPRALVFHAATAFRHGKLVTTGGRVLTVVGSGGSFRDAIDTAYRAASLIHFDGMQFRRDIGRKALSSPPAAGASSDD